MGYFCLSFTHKNTVLDIREQLALDNERKSELLKLILANNKISECVLLSTCNRTEIMCYVDDDSIGISDYLLKSLCLVCKVPFELIVNSPDIYEDSGFVHHIFSVASSLDSLVIGETQIVSQLKDALSFASEYYQVNKLSVVINCAFKCAASVRNETQISKHKISISSVAVDDALKQGQFKKVLIIGSGEMARLCAKHLNSACDITSLTFSNAKALAAQLPCAKALEFERLAEFINEYDLIFTATSSNAPILHARMFDDKPRLIYDIAVPKDTGFSEFKNTRVICVDDLKQIVAMNMQLKEEQAKAAYKIIAAKVREFFAKEQELIVVPIIKALREQARIISDEQCELALKKGYLKDCDLQRVRRFCHQLFKAYLHAPTIRLKNSQGFELDSLRYIFDVKEDNEIY